MSETSLTQRTTNMLCDVSYAGGIPALDFTIHYFIVLLTQLDTVTCTYRVEVIKFKEKILKNDITAYNRCNMHGQNQSPCIVFVYYSGLKKLRITWKLLYG